jgi:hypothetical protein
MTENRVFGHTFSNLPQNILAATLEITLRAGITLPGNDSIALDYNNGTFSYGRLISDLVGSWGDNDIATLTLDLDNLPGSSTSILSSINDDHALDIYIQDDTGIDFARLTVVACSIPDEVEELLNKDLVIVVESEKDEVIDLEGEVKTVLVKEIGDAISLINLEIKDVEVGIGVGQSIDVEQVEPKFIRLS